MLEFISGPSQTFFSVVTTIAFALFLASRGLEVIRRFKIRDEDYRYLRSISILSALTIISSSLPLALAAPDGFVSVKICGLGLLVLSALAFSHTLFELFKRKITFFFKKLSYFLLFSSAACMAIVFVVAFFYPKLVIYKALVLYLLLLLMWRFYLIIGFLAFSEDVKG